MANETIAIGIASTNNIVNSFAGGILGAGILYTFKMAFKLKYALLFYFC